MNYYEHHLGDYLRDTAHLSMVEDGAYRRLLDAYYIRELALPADLREVFRLVRAQEKAARKAVTDVLAEFFFLGERGWEHARCEREISRFQDKQRKAKASADARWANRPAPQDQASDRNANASANAQPDAMRTHSEGNAPRARPQTPVTSNQTPEEKKTSNLAVAPARPADAQLALVPGGKPKTPPDCPHLAILALWAEALPALPQHDPKRWRGAKADHLRARWSETAKAEGWVDQAHGLSYFRKFFAYVGRSEFLTGRAPPLPGKRPFVVELEWLVIPANWDKVHEGKYHPEQAA